MDLLNHGLIFWAHIWHLTVAQLRMALESAH